MTKHWLSHVSPRPNVFFIICTNTWLGLKRWRRGRAVCSWEEGSEETKEWESGALKGLGVMRKQMCWIGKYVSKAALTPHSWCVIVSSPSYQIREEPKEHISFLCFCNGYSLSSDPDKRWLHTISTLGFPGCSVCHLCPMTKWCPGCQRQQRMKLWHGNAQTTSQQLRNPRGSLILHSQAHHEIKNHWDVTWHLD